MSALKDTINGTSRRCCFDGAAVAAGHRRSLRCQGSSQLVFSGWG